MKVYQFIDLYLEVVAMNKLYGNESFLFLILLSIANSSLS